MSTLSDKRSGRKQYLITYSKADAAKFPTRESFAQMLEDSFNFGKSVVKVDHWACCREPHEHGGFHYHCSLKLSGNKKWVSVKERITAKHGIVVNFSDSHDHYTSAYRYVCKDDKEVVHSKDHPNLAEARSPRTKRSIAANRAAGKKRKSETSTQGCKIAPKKKRLSNSDVAAFIRKQNIKTYTGLFATAEKRREEGENDIADFIFSRSEKYLRELISKVWLMKDAPDKIQGRATTRIDKVRNALKEECASGCNRRWFECATEVLQLNNIDKDFYAKSLKDSLINGRGKFRNIMLVGPANCAKTFMLKPLKYMFTAEELFENPSNDKFGWVGAEKASILILQDFRWSKDSIAWKDLLLLLEGETVKLPAPKNFYAEDIVMDGDVAIFATSKVPVLYRGPYNTTDADEDAMMKVRWNTITFHHRFSQEDQKIVKPCARCFAELALIADN